MSNSHKQINRLAVQRSASRYSLAAGMSVLVHLVLGGYLAFLTVGDVEVLEIREINFIDETEKPKLSPRLGSGPRARQARPASPKTTSPKAKIAQKQPSRKSPAVEALSNSLPLIPAAQSRIALAKADPSDVLRVADSQSGPARPRLASFSKPLDLRKKTRIGTRSNLLGVESDPGRGNPSLNRPSMPN
ncbi:hypothetical protein MJD09_17785, partial [bacterium]|nr:hypothetical protein [bacterium]